HPAAACLYLLSLHDALPIFPFFSARVSHEGDVLSVHPRVSGTVAGVSADGERVALSGSSRMGVYDFARDRWLEGWPDDLDAWALDRKSTRLNSSHVKISYAV